MRAGSAGCNGLLQQCFRKRVAFTAIMKAAMGRVTVQLNYGQAGHSAIGRHTKSFTNDDPPNFKVESK